MTPMTNEECLERVDAIIKEDPRMILAFRSKVLTDEMWEYAVAMEPSLFAECKRKTFRVASIAIAGDGLNLEYVDPINYTGEQYKKLCNLAVKQNPKAIILVPKEFRTEELIGYAYANDPELLLSEKKLSEGMVESIIDHNPSLIRFVVEPTDNMIMRALSKDPRVIVYFPVISEAVRDYYEETYPQYAAMLLHN